MLPDNTGRFCNSCQKSVVDFTALADEEIQQYFIKHQGQPVCGRFKNTQIQRIVIDLPQNILSIRMPLWMRVLVACLLIFGISIFPFETTVAGKTPAHLCFSQGMPITFKHEKKPRIIKKKKWNKHKRKHVSTLKDYPVFEETMTVAGYTVSEPNPPLPKSIFNTVADTIAALDTATVSTEHHSVPEKKHPGPTPYIPSEFILPTILLPKRKNKNIAMD